MELLALKGIYKYFPSTGTRALIGADFSLEKGEIHALVGENGAGKSTLARVICGLVKPDAGAMAVRGRELSFRTHRDAEKAGIGLVPQHSMLAPGLTVAENLALGHEPRRFGLFFDARKARYEAAMLAERYGFSVNPAALVSSLGPSQRREAEILRAMARGAEILILDEPTSILSEVEAKVLFALIRRLTAAGAGVVYISHRVREILDLADRVTVLRNGKTMATTAADQLDESSLAELIIPMGAIASPRPDESRVGHPVLEIRGAQLGSSGGIDLVVRAGEAVGVVALAGNSLDALEDLVVGLTPSPPGSVLLLGKNLAYHDRGRLRTKLMAYLPTDREGRALSARSSVRKNILAGRLGEYGRIQYAMKKMPNADARAMTASFEVRGALNGPANALSGGNRQKLVAARELTKRPRLVVAANPAQGLDPASRALIFRRLAELRDQGAAILILSQDPDDLAEIADRAFALYRGMLTPIQDDKLGRPVLSALLTGARA
ncbi:MAG: ATP-binding cassette domain-containing protein [Spirochaetales bacterium]|nr:MAG: ATP-binding cassette domain-containing protein [Spirochaetales bacterium]